MSEIQHYSCAGYFTINLSRTSFHTSFTGTGKIIDFKQWNKSWLFHSNIPKVTPLPFQINDDF